MRHSKILTFVLICQLYDIQILVGHSTELNPHVLHLSYQFSQVLWTQLLQDWQRSRWLLSCLRRTREALRTRCLRTRMTRYRPCLIWKNEFRIQKFSITVHLTSFLLNGRPVKKILNPAKINHWINNKLNRKPIYTLRLLGWIGMPLSN